MKEIKLSKLNRRNISYLIIILFLILTLTGVLEAVIDFLFLDHVYQSNIQFLEESNSSTRNSFLLISTFKMITSIVEGSTIDITVLGLEAGDFVQPFYNLLNITWQFLLAALVSINIQKILLEIAASIKKYFSFFVSFAVISLIFEYYIRALKLKNKLLDFFLSLYALVYKVLVLTVVLIVIFLPLFIYSSELLSTTFIDSHIEEASQEINSNLEKITEESDIIKEEVVAVSPISIIDGSSGRNVKESLVKIFQSSPELFNNTINHLFLLIASFVLKIFIIPLLILILEFYLLKYALKYFVELFKKFNLEEIVNDKEKIRLGKFRI
ncbi:MAG: hypothetical protein ACOCWN_04945 [Halanaerobium sp.]